MSLQSSTQSFFTTIRQMMWPVSGLRPHLGGLGWWIRWTIHIILVLLMLVLLGLINWYFKLDELIPRVDRTIAKLWLPILFILLYAMAWLGWYLISLLDTPGEGAEFTDIYDAWQAGMMALKSAGIDIREVPLFLILGRPESGEDSLFAASQLPLPVRNEPRNPAAPLHFFGNNEGVYITCCGASLTGTYVAQLTATQLEAGGGAMHMIPGKEEEDEGMRTMMPGASNDAGRVRDILSPALREGRALTPVERREARMFVRKEKPRQAFLRQLNSVEFHEARLGYLCRLMVGERNPRPPLNGVLLLIPFAGLDLDQDANDTGDVMLRDLTVIRRTTCLTCPRFAVVADCETAPGFKEFIQQFSAQERRPRLGQKCPLDPDLSRSAVSNPNSTPLVEMFASLGAWVSNGVIPTWVYKKFKTEKRDAPNGAEMIEINARMFLFLEEFRLRQDRLALVLARAVGMSTTGAPWFGGLYLSGTGSNPALEHAFVPGVMRRLIEEQDYIAWTNEALDEDVRFQQLSMYLYGVLGLIALLTALLIAWAVFK